MRLTIERLVIRNFKGIKEQGIIFDPIETTICGENGVGKTTVVDAFNWLLFEKDSQGRTQFEIKTLNEDGQVIHGLDHSVEGFFKIDGKPLNLKKIYREVWTLKNGDEQETFGGHERERFINDVPVTKTDYDKKIGELVDEKIFQLLTDPLHFSQQLHWKDRRKTLFELDGETVGKEDILMANPELKDIEEDLEDKTIEELKDALKYQRGALNKEKEHIPVKIKTLYETVKEVDMDITNMRIRDIKDNISKVEEEMVNGNAVNEYQLKKQNQLYELKSRQKELEYETKQNIKDPNEELRNQVNEFKIKLRELGLEEQNEQRILNNLNERLSKEKRELQELRDTYSREADKTIEITDDIKGCPTCERPFPEDEIQSRIAKLEENFKSHQVETLTRLRSKGQELAKEVEGRECEIRAVETRISDIDSEIKLIKESIERREQTVKANPMPKLEELLGENEDYQTTIKLIKQTAKELKDQQNTRDLTGLRIKKERLEEDLKTLEKDLHQDEINKDTQEKIDTLMSEEKRLSRKINEIERKEKLVDKYITTQAELIEESINKKFQEVSFRLFKKQTNGKLDETCEVLVDGVPFDNANTAGRVNAGLDVINSLCRHHEIYTPIFIDNRECVNDLIDTNSQLVNLKVTRHKTLRIEQEG